MMGFPMEDDPPPGKLVRLMVAPVPLRKLRMRPVRERVYAPPVKMQSARPRIRREGISPPHPVHLAHAENVRPERSLLPCVLVFRRHGPVGRLLRSIGTGRACGHASHGL